MLRSIRGRVQVWHTLILLLVVSGFGGMLYVQSRQARYGEVDAELHAAARSLEGTMRALPAPLLDGRPRPPDPPGPDGRRFRGFGQPGGPPFFRDEQVSREPGFPGLPGGPGAMRRPGRPDIRERLDRELRLPDSWERRSPEDAPPYFAIWLADGSILKSTTAEPVEPVPWSSVDSAKPFTSRQQAEWREVLLAGPQGSLILVGRSMAREQEELRQLAWQLAFAGLGVLVIGLPGGWLLSRRAVYPIQTMSQTAASISAEHLSRRIDLQRVDDELGQLAEVLNAMFGRLEQAFERQTRFTADASHELRTPLSVILSHAELALARPRSPEAYREALETCLRSARRMKALVEGLLELARADAGRIQLQQQPLDLVALVEESSELLAPLAASQGLQMTVSANPIPTIRGDPERLSQVLVNLISNAIHYNRPGGSVAVHLEATQSQVILSISDTGIGIPEEEHQQVFERFYRADKARSRERGGCGLGLAICKSIVEAHGGTIAFTSSPSEGTIFVVRLPEDSSSLS